jgi:ribonuclease T2
MTLPRATRPLLLLLFALGPLLQLAACGGGDRQEPQPVPPSIQAEDTVRIASTAAPLPAPAPAMTPVQSQVIAAPADAPRRLERAPQAVADASGGTPAVASGGAPAVASGGAPAVASSGAPAVASSGAPVACRLPSNIEAPAVRGPDHRNTTRTDYLMLVLSWSPAFCAELNASSSRRHAVQCSLNDFGFVVHGLWPQNERARSWRDHPRHCRSSDALPVTLVRRHLCTVPGAELMQNEWQAHGTCHWSRAEDYFASIESLWSQLRRPAMKDLSQEATAGDIKRAFVSLNAGRLKTEHLQVTVASGNWLRDVRICLTVDARPVPRACPRGGTPDDRRVRIARSRGT